MNNIKSNPLPNINRQLSFEPIHPSWRVFVQEALNSMNSDYLQQLETTENWLPGADKIFRAFSLPLPNVRYILLGESPYPRAQSANGYAFWDDAVDHLWSEHGLAKPVNRATSLRNFIKMLLVARGDLSADDTSQPAIASLPKEGLVTTISELFNNLMAHGVMLLNATLVLSDRGVRADAKYWKVFLNQLLRQLAVREGDPKIELILFGRVAKEIHATPVATAFKQFHAEHPYNISFITNPNVLDFFRAFDLLKTTQKTTEKTE